MSLNVCKVLETVLLEYIKLYTTHFNCRWWQELRDHNFVAGSGQQRITEGFRIAFQEHAIWYPAIIYWLNYIVGIPNECMVGAGFQVSMARCQVMSIPCSFINPDLFGTLNSTVKMIVDLGRESF